MKKMLIVTLLSVLSLAVGCNKDEDGANNGSAKGSPATDAHSTQQAAHSTEAQHNRIPIGEMTDGGLKLVATMDAPVKAGGEGAFDVVITGGKPKAVRFWVGAEDAEGSVKARAEEETPDNWHTHVEVPSPLPPDSRFWVEVEPPTGDSFKASFDLKVE